MISKTKNMFTKLTALALISSTANASYLLTRTYSNANCSSTIIYQMSTSVNLCQRNSYQPGTYRVECIDKPGTAYDSCTTEAYKTPDCSGSGTTTRKFDASGQCTATQGQHMTFSIVADHDAKQGFSTPILRQWQDEDCAGTPVEYIDEGICHGHGDDSYRTACLKGKIMRCQYSKSADCTGTDSTCVPAPQGVPVGQCGKRGRFGGKASVQYDC